MINFNTDSSSIDAALDALGKKLAGEVIIAGAAAAAKEFYDEARLQVPVDSGLLQSAIYRVLSKDNTDSTKVTYHISWNKRKAPHGHLIEYGTSRAPAYPFMRPAYHLAKVPAAQAAKARMAEKMAQP